MAEEKKEGLLVRIKTAFEKAVDNILDGSDTDVIMDLGAIALFIIGSVITGIGAQFAFLLFLIPGIAFMILAFVRFAYNVS